MKLAIMSDIHSNPDAFQTALNDAYDNKCEEIVCLGDVVGYGYAPIKCIHMLTEDVPNKGLGMVCVMGNHDAALCDKIPISWFSETAAAGVIRQKKILTESNRMWLSSLDYTAKHEFENGLKAFYAHGSYVPERSFYSSEDEMFPYMTGVFIVHRNIKKMHESGDNSVLFVGHVHARRICQVGEDFKNFKDCNSFSHALKELDPETQRIDISSGHTVINVGSVGYPRLEPIISYAIMDTDKKEVQMRVLPFKFRSYVENMKKNGIPIPGWMRHWHDSETDLYYGESKEGKDVQ